MCVYVCACVCVCVCTCRCVRHDPLLTHSSIILTHSLTRSLAHSPPTHSITLTPFTHTHSLALTRHSLTYHALTYSSRVALDYVFHELEGGYTDAILLEDDLVCVCVCVCV